VSPAHSARHGLSAQHPAEGVHAKQAGLAAHPALDTVDVEIETEPSARAWRREIVGVDVESEIEVGGHRGRVQRADPQPATPHDAVQEASAMGTGYVYEGDMDTAHVKEAALAALLTSH
jgi:hypothetical protein